MTATHILPRGDKNRTQLEDSDSTHSPEYIWHRTELSVLPAHPALAGRALCKRRPMSDTSDFGGPWHKGLSAKLPELDKKAKSPHACASWPGPGSPRMPCPSHGRQLRVSHQTRPGAEGPGNPARMKDKARPQEMRFPFPGAVSRLTPAAHQTHRSSWQSPQELQGRAGWGAAGAPGRCPSPETHPARTLRSRAPQDTGGAHHGSKDRAKRRDCILTGLMSRGQSHPLSRGEPVAQGRPEETHSCNCCFHKQPRTIKSTDVATAREPTAREAAVHLRHGEHQAGLCRGGRILAETSRVGRCQGAESCRRQSKQCEKALKQGRSGRVERTGSRPQAWGP